MNQNNSELCDREKMKSTSKKQNGTITGETTGQVTKKSGKGLGMLAMKTEAGRTTNHAASST
jgi:thymidine phosphorylase